jgi:hypothetical protein
MNTSGTCLCGSGLSVGTSGKCYMCLYSGTNNYYPYNQQATPEVNLFVPDVQIQKAKNGYILKISYQIEIYRTLDELLKRLQAILPL